MNDVLEDSEITAEVLEAVQYPSKNEMKSIRILLPGQRSIILPGVFSRKSLMLKMSRLTKFGLVIGGYVAACLTTGAVVYIWQQYTQDASAQASAGMYAGGDLLLYIGVFGVLALIPTGLAVYFLVRKFLSS